MRPTRAAAAVLATLASRRQPATSSAVPTDGPSSFKFPTNAGHFSTLAIASPQALWQCQEASGSLADSIGTFTLSAAGTGIAYNSAVAGYTRTGVSFTDGGTGLFSNTTVGDASTTSIMVALYAILDSTPVAVRSFAGIGTTTMGGLRIETTPRLRAQFGGALATGTTSPTGAVGLYMFHRDVTAGANRGARSAELLTPASTALAGARVGLGAAAGANCPACRILWACMWTGAEAEGLTNLRTKFQALSGLTVGW